MRQKHEPRVYRDFSGDERFIVFRVAVETSDLYVKALVPLESETEALVRLLRGQIERAIERRPCFLTSLAPIEPDPEDAPIVAMMVRAGKKAGTGPMAAVAGAVAHCTGTALLEKSPELIIENGGDVFIKSALPTTVGIYAGASPLTGRIGIEVPPGDIPMGVCSSSGKVGPSFSAGAAHAAIVIAPDTALADAAATALGNRIRGPDDLEWALEWVLTIEGVRGAAAVIEDRFAACGEVKIVPTDLKKNGVSR
jgi:ApbE superfamily uncharacterized protein (UPF0280 family)